MWRLRLARPPLPLTGMEVQSYWALLALYMNNIPQWPNLIIMSHQQLLSNSPAEWPLPGWTSQAQWNHSPLVTAAACREVEETQAAAAACRCLTSCSSLVIPAAPRQPRQNYVGASFCCVSSHMDAPPTRLAGALRCAAPVSASAGERAAADGTQTHCSCLCAGDATGPFVHNK